VSALDVLSARLERRDPYTLGHSVRVTEVARSIAARLGCDVDDLVAIELGGPLHDLGKLAIRDDVLLKPGSLDEAELEEIRRHPEAGVDMIRDVPELRPAVPCVLHHHERWDGGGYPHGLVGAAIPRPARILAVADAFDAMTSTRSYRRARPVAAAVAELERCAGAQFDPRMVDALVRALGRYGWHPTVTSEDTGTPQESEGRSPVIGAPR
jgi:HD-GYP domain-containing protein (c-di-GMP phosphodiesterase class II)